VAIWKVRGGKVLVKSGADENEMNFSALKIELPNRSKLTTTIETWLKQKYAEYNRGRPSRCRREHKIQQCIEEFC
jgi:hypothetical protein